MNLYRIWQPAANVGYDTYDSAIVAAKSEEEARRVHPGGEWREQCWEEHDHVWCRSPEDVTAELIGVAIKGTKRGVVLASFNAG